MQLELSDEAETLLCRFVSEHDQLRGALEVVRVAADQLASRSDADD